MRHLPAARFFHIVHNEWANFLCLSQDIFTSLDILQKTVCTYVSWAKMNSFFHLQAGLMIRLIAEFQFDMTTERELRWWVIGFDTLKTSFLMHRLRNAKGWRKIFLIPGNSEQPRAWKQRNELRNNLARRGWESFHSAHSMQTFWCGPTIQFLTQGLLLAFWPKTSAIYVGPILQPLIR